MLERDIILVIDDEKTTRESLKRLIEEARLPLFSAVSATEQRFYQIVEAENSTQGRRFLYRYSDRIATILLDLNSTIDQGLRLLSEITGDEKHKDIPVIVITAKDNEKKALEAGAWDFIRMPHDQEVIKARIKNAIYRNQLMAYKKLRELAEIDKLTKLYNKEKFYDVTAVMLKKNKDKRFVFIRFDIDKFQQFNTFFGISSGDELLKYVGDVVLRQKYDSMSDCTYGRIESDIFGICHEYDESKILDEISSIREDLSRYKTEYDIVPSIGLYVIEDNQLPVKTIFNRANLAANHSKKNYIKFYTFYNDRMGNNFIKEQEIINEMKGALEQKQFDVYFQPKYNLASNKPDGAEALVRWFHPQKGMIMPGEFIPVFEKNGFISKLDYYVWERTCQYLRKWMDEGKNVFPVSVNVSRVNMYNPNIVETIKELTTRYGISPKLLNLELTESAYTEDPLAIKEVVARFRENGFVIMMDDFGSGYSSLNILKDILVDVLKVDMQFLSKTDIPGRGENILASVIRMAKWLKLPVIVEGVETASQKRFLKSIGCDYVQGFFFARPMPEADYIRLLDDNLSVEENEIEEYSEADINALFNKNPQMEILFSNQQQPIVIIEYSDHHIDLVRVNDAYYNLLGKDDRNRIFERPLEVVMERDREKVLAAFETVSGNKKSSKVEYRRLKSDGGGAWISMKLQYVYHVGNKDVLIATLIDITIQKAIANMIEEFKNSDLDQKYKKDTIMIIAESELDPIWIYDMLSEYYTVFEEKPDDEVLKKLREVKEISLIVFDMMAMEGKLKDIIDKIKKDQELKDIPIIVITSDDSEQSQTELFSMGIEDSITKPFVKQMVMKRIDNIISSFKNKKLLQRNNDIADKLSELQN